VNSLQNKNNTTYKCISFWNSEKRLGKETTVIQVKNVKIERM
jgi:hypothetical protein